MRPCIVVVCPLEVERRAVASVAARFGVPLIRSGHGPAGVRSAVEIASAQQDAILILAGLAGALCEAQGCFRVESVLDMSGRRWECPWGGSLGGWQTATVLGVDGPVLSAHEKRRLAGEYPSATLVDMESHVFASACEASGLRWLILRSVSDGPHDELPTQAPRWVDAAGRTRPKRVVIDLLRHPRQAPATFRLAHAARMALKNLRNGVEDMLSALAVGMGEQANDS